MSVEPTSPADIRTVALLGHGGTGKTALGEALLAAGGVGARGGVLSTEEERERGHTLSLGTASFDWQDVRVVLLDTPGHPDFVGDAYPALRGADLGVFVIDAVDGVQPQHDALWAACDQIGLPRLVVLNGLDRERAGYTEHVEALRERCGTPLAPVHMPLGLESEFRGVVDLLHERALTPGDGERKTGPIPDDHREEAAQGRQMLVEAIVETDDDMLEAYLEGQEPSAEALGRAFAHGIATCGFFPLLCTSIDAGLGVRSLADFLVEAGPSPADRSPVAGLAGGEPAERDVDGPLALHVIKTRSDAYLGRVNVMRVVAGMLTPDTEVTVARTGAAVRLHHLLRLEGNEQQPCGRAIAGDIVAVAKLDDVLTGDTLHDLGAPFELPGVFAPAGEHRVAVRPQTSSDEDKLSTALARLLEEDPSLRVEREEATRQLVLATAGPGHADAAIARLQHRFGVAVEPVPLQVAYRETLAGPGSATGKIKKQTGGAGQFGVAVVEVEPLERGEGFVFEDRIVGGVIPRQYIPSVEKGVREAMGEGVLAGFPVVDVKVSLVDGKSHSVDSSQVAFELAGAAAFREAATDAGLHLLEPIMSVEVDVPDAQVGDVMGDLSARRGRIVGTEPAGQGRTRISAEVPQAELQGIVPELRALTHGAGSVTTSFARYEIAPSQVAQQVVGAREPAEV